MIKIFNKILQRKNIQLKRHLNVISALRTRKAYYFVAELGKNKDVMDYGCGPGFGTDIISKTAKSIIGVDIRQKALNYASKTYTDPNISFQKVNPTYPLPFADRRFDLIISSHVIEHIPNVLEYVLELKRILKIGGKLILSTPNRKFRLLPFQKPFNPYHFREYSVRNLKREIKKAFVKFEILGVYGNKRINLLEKINKRLLKNPVKVYIFNPILFILHKILPKSIMNILIRPIFSRNRSYMIEKKIENFNNYRYTLDDFIIGKNHKLGVDLIAICQK